MKMQILAWLAAHGSELISAISGLLSAMIILALMIPGEQPEKSLQKLVDLLGKFSRK